MYNYLIGMVATGDNSKPWLIVVITLLLLGLKDRDDDEDDTEE